MFEYNKTKTKNYHLFENVTVMSNLCTTTVLKYKTPMKKLRRLRKWVIVLNLLIISIVFKLLSFMRKNE
jgi:hypothetical protein